MKIVARDQVGIPIFSRKCQVVLQDIVDGSKEELKLFPDCPELGKMGFAELGRACNDTGSSSDESDFLRFLDDAECNSPPRERRRLSEKKLEELKPGVRLGASQIAHFREASFTKNKVRLHDLPGFTAEFSLDEKNQIAGPAKILDLYWSERECKIWGGIPVRDAEPFNEGLFFHCTFTSLPRLIYESLELK